MPRVMDYLAGAPFTGPFPAKYLWLVVSAIVLGGVWEIAATAGVGPRRSSFARRRHLPAPH
jgi:hypothetical protein